MLGGGRDNVTSRWEIAGARAAEPIINQNFDTTPAVPYTYDYHYAAGGDNGGPNEDLSGFARSSNTLVGNGVGGAGNALTVGGDFTDVPRKTSYNYAGFGGGFGNFRDPAGLPAPRLSDYAFTVDMKGAGYAPGQSTVPVEIQIQIQVADEAYGRGDADTDADPFAQIVKTVDVGPGYGTFTFTLDQATLKFEDPVPAAERDFAKYFNKVANINMNFNADAGTAMGLDADNFLSIDNVRLNFTGVVPEPASALLLALVGLGGLARRPRRS